MKSNRKKSEKPTQAILTPDARDRRTGRAIPDPGHVEAAKKFVEENQK